MRPRSTSLARLAALVSVIMLSVAITLATETPARAAGGSGETAFVPGTSIGMTPPPGFAPSATFAGFEDPRTGSSFLIVEFPPEAYAQMIPAFSDAALASHGISVSLRRNVTIDGAKGVSLTGTQTVGSRTANKWTLVLAGEAATVMVTAQDLSGQGLDDATVGAAFASIRFRPARSLEQQIAEAPIAVGDLAGFRITQIVTGLGLILTKGPEDIVRDASQPVILITRPIGAGYPTNSGPAALSSALLRTIESVRMTHIGDTAKGRVAGDDGYEVSATARDIASGTTVAVTQWLYLKPGRQVRMVAIVPADQHERLLPDLRAVADGIRLR